MYDLTENKPKTGKMTIFFSVFCDIYKDLSSSSGSLLNIKWKIRLFKLVQL